MSGFTEQERRLLDLSDRSDGLGPKLPAAPKRVALCTTCHKASRSPGNHRCLECQRVWKQQWWERNGHLFTLKARLQTLTGRLKKLHLPNGTCVICGCVEHTSECGIGTLAAQANEVLSQWERK